MIDLCIVTGGGRGIGRAIAIEMSKHCPVITTSVNNSALRFNFAAEPDRVSAQETFHSLAHGRVGLVLAAGNLIPNYRLSYAINVLGNLAVIEGCHDAMKAAKFGRILFFAGGGSAYANPLFPAYSASKTALVRITENLHEELKDQGDFAVTILSPGAVETDMLAQVRAAGGDIRTPVPMEEPVNFAREFLCSENAKNLSGRLVHVRDDWQWALSGQEFSADRWKLRRVE